MKRGYRKIWKREDMAEEKKERNEQKTEKRTVRE
jgi:hypothetical protein